MQPTRAGTANDAFISVINPTETGLVYSSYLGGNATVLKAHVTLVKAVHVTELRTAINTLRTR